MHIAELLAEGDSMPPPHAVLTSLGSGGETAFLAESGNSALESLSAEERAESDAKANKKTAFYICLAGLLALSLTAYGMSK